MSSIPPVTAKKLSLIQGDFLAMNPAEQLEFICEVRGRRLKPVQPVKLKAPKPKKEKKVGKTKEQSTESPAWGIPAEAEEQAQPVKIEVVSGTEIRITIV